MTGSVFIDASLAQRQAQIGRADVKGVDAGQRGDRIDIGEAGGGLDHGDGEHRVVGGGGIIVAGVEHGALGAIAADASGWVAAGSGKGDRPRRRR